MMRFLYFTAVLLRLTLPAQAQDIATTCNPLPPAVVNQPYTLALRQTGFSEAPRWLASTLPSGLSLSPESGLLSGTPTTAGEFDITLMAINTPRQQAAASACRLSVLPEAATLFILTSESLPAASAITAYATTLSVTGGVAPYQWSLAAETALPDGLHLSPEGRVAGIPARSGTFRFEAAVTDSDGQTTERAFLLVVNRAPSLEIAQDRVTFSAEQGATTPSQATVELTSQTPLPFSVATSTTDGEAWLSATPEEGEAPSSLQLVADPSSLPAGTFRGKATLETGAEQRVIEVTLQIAAPSAPPKLAVDPTELPVSHEPGSGTLTRTFRILNTGSGTLAFEASLADISGGGLQLDPSSGSASPSEPATLTLTFDPAQAEANATASTARIEVRAADGQTATIPVTIQRLAALSVTPSVVQSRAFPNEQSLPVFLRLRNESRRSIDWQAQSDVPNLQITPGRGTLAPNGPDQEIIAISADPVALPEGDYEATINIHLPATSETRTVTLRSTVAPLAESDSVLASPPSLALVSPASNTNVFTDLLLQNPNATPLEIQISAEAPWLSINPARATIRPGEIARIRLGANPGELANATYSTTVVVNSGLPNPTTVPVSFTVGGECAAQALLINLRQPLPNTSVPPGTAVQFEADVQTNCGAPLTAGVVAAFFQNGDPALMLTHAGRGRWTGTYLTAQSGIAEFAVTANAAPARSATPQPTIRLGIVFGRIQVGGTALPTVTEIYETASQRSGPPLVAPGSIITLRGRNLLANGMRVDTPPWPTQLGNLTVLLNGQSVPIFGANAELVQIQLPFALPDADLSLTVRRANAISAPIALTRTQARPGILTADSTGTGLGRFRGPNGRPIGPRNSTALGETVTVLCTGLGAVDTPQQPGRPATGSARVAAPVTVTIGGQTTSALTAILSTETTGVYEVRFTIPRNSQTGTEVPVFVTVASATSQTVTIPISAPTGGGAQ